MKALVFHGSRDVRYEQHEDPTITSDGAVIVQVESCSICGSDLHIYHGDTIGRFDYDGDVEPFCVGHEFIGSVVAAGPAVHNTVIGDRVFVAGGAPCGRCPACASRVGRCARWATFGVSAALHGGQAELVEVPQADSVVHKIPEWMSDEQALLLTDAMATAHFGITRCEIVPGDVVAVVGLGPIGLIGVEMAFLHGASTVIAVDPVATRRERAERLGAVALPSGDDLVAKVRDITNGRLADRIFEASGTSAAISSVPLIAGRRATASFIGVPQQDASLDMTQLLFRGLTVRAGVAPVPELWSAILPLLESQRLVGADLFSHSFKLSQGAEAYELFDSRDDGVIKIRFDL